MRPQRLELEGFGPYRDHTEVDFTGVDLFALSGPTGSGKTSIVDAIVFALYGCVPRYDDRRLVGPAISQGAAEARVRLDFSAGGEDYVAVRVVRRQKGGGATTKEARLEHAGTVIAGNEKELGVAVEAILGLGYDQFTKCVVLPQGEFARFLHDKPDARQALLVKLLDIGVYEAMGKLARTRAVAADGRLSGIDQQLTALAGATTAARAGQAERVVALGRLHDDVDRELARLGELDVTARAATAEADALAADVQTLRALKAPKGVASLDAALALAVAADADAVAALDGAVAAIDTAEAAVAALASRRVLETALERHAQRSQLQANHVKGEKVLAERAADVRAAADARAATDAARSTAASALDQAAARHRAHAVAVDLKPGEPCPVCEQVVSRLPLMSLPPDLDAARAADKAAAAAAERAAAALSRAEQEHGAIEQRLTSIADQLAELDAALQEHPDPAAVEATLARVASAEADHAAARAAEKAVRAAVTAARQALDAARRAEGDARTGFDTARDRVAGLGPPARTGQGLAADWDALVAWASEAVAARTAAATAATAKAQAAESEREGALATLATQCAVLDVQVGRQPRDAVVEALAVAEVALARLDEDITTASTLRRERDRVDGERQVAHALGQHLGSKNFEKWVLDEALGLLVDGATQILLELSAGQYSMALDDRTGNFLVVDHRNADETRSARSLSGGETFMASLALALALADQLALLAAKGAARLESIFLDEGFGSLDPGALDVVAAAIEELGARGRMVGLISHVAELAERVPVRFEVTKSGNAATIQRVER
jgi:exonuclease SbcC